MSSFIWQINSNASSKVKVAKLHFSVADPDPGSGSFLTPGSWIRIRNEQPGSYFLELRNHFFGVKILKFFDADPGSGMKTFRIRDSGWKKEKNLANFKKIIELFTQKIVTKLSKIWVRDPGSGIRDLFFRDPEKTYSESRI
jgi:hypothetical protein